MNETIAATAPAARSASEPPAAPSPPAAAVGPRRGVSIVWLIPLVAALVGAFLAWRAYTSEGPTVTIGFATAEGLEAGKTKVRYLDVEVGTVQTVAIAPDLRGIEVTARMVPGASAYLRAGTKFWIVRPRVGVGGISGLGTLLSGAYVGLAPGEGEAAWSFTGLEEPPPIDANEPGRRYTLTAAALGSVSPGAPIYFRGVDVGQVLGYRLAREARTLDVDVFVREPYRELVRTTSRFWNASGISVVTGASGIAVQVASLQALLVGGIEFDTPPGMAEGPVAGDGTTFELFASREAVAQAQFTAKVPYLVYFDGSVRGLNPGAPVEFRGIRVGSVTEVRLDFDRATSRVRIPVTIEIEPQRILPDDAAGPALPTADHRIMAQLVERGLRAQLQTGNLLTGELFVDLTFVPGGSPAKLDTSGPVPAIPSVPATLEELQASVTSILNKVAGLPLDELAASLNRTAGAVERIVASPDLQQALGALGPALAQLRQTVARLDGSSEPVLASLRGTADAAAATLREAEGTLAAARRTIGPDSRLANGVEGMMQELTRAARSIRGLADYLNRYPEALIRGKAGAGGR